jgi:hypothetical protein
MNHLPCPLCSTEPRIPETNNKCYKCGFEYDDDAANFIAIDPNTLPTGDSNLWTRIHVYGMSSTHNSHPEWPLFNGVASLLAHLNRMYPVPHPALKRIATTSANYVSDRECGRLYVSSNPWLGLSELLNNVSDLPDDDLIRIASSPTPVLIHRYAFEGAMYNFSSRSVKGLNQDLESRRPGARAQGLLVYSNEYKGNYRLGLNASSLKRNVTRNANKDVKKSLANHRSTRIDHWTPESFNTLYRFFEGINRKFTYLKEYQPYYRSYHNKPPLSYKVTDLIDLMGDPQTYTTRWINGTDPSGITNLQSCFARYVMNTLHAADKRPGLLRSIHRVMGPGTLVLMYAIYLDGRARRYGYPAAPRSGDPTTYPQCALRYLNRVTTSTLDTTIPDWWSKYIPPRYTEADLLNDFPELKPKKSKRSLINSTLPGNDILIDVTLNSTPAQCGSDSIAPEALTSTV